MDRVQTYVKTNVEHVIETDDYTKLSEMLKKSSAKKILVLNKKDKVKFNNLAMTSYAETNRLITSLSIMVMQEKTQQKDPFWNNSAKNLLEGFFYS
mgnify:CR=1 FL=1